MRGRAWHGWLFVLVAACSSNSDAAPPPAPCPPVCNRLSACGAGSCNCATFDRWLPAIRDGFFACVNDKATLCDPKMSDQCISLAAASSPARASDADYTTACVKKRTDCSNIYPDDYCSSRLLADPWVTKLQACLAKACTDVSPCLEAILK
jgi:hypothetical protein